MLTNTQAVIEIGFFSFCETIRNLICRSLKLLSHLLLREWRLLVLLVFIGVGVTGVRGLVNWIALVCRLEWNFGDAGFKAEESEVGAAAPCKRGEEREENRAAHVATADVVWRVRRFTPLTADVAETDEVHESPEAREAEICQHIMLPRLRRRHLFEEIFTRDESHRGEKSHQTDPHGVRANTSVAVDDAHVFAILVFHVSIRHNRTEHDDGKHLKQFGASVTQHPKVTLDEKLSIFSTPQPPEKAKRM